MDKKMSQTVVVAVLLLISMTTMSCISSDDIITIFTAKQAYAEIGALGDGELYGVATFTQFDDTVALSIDIGGVAPGVYAVHIHEHGDCSSPDGLSAGGHWNPTGVAHGKWGEGEFHLGDLGNITVDQHRTGFLELETDLWEIGTGSERDVVGKSIVVHAGADDFTSQPSGNAGARIGCGVIVLADFLQLAEE